MSDVVDKIRIFKSHHRRLVRYFIEGVGLTILLAILFTFGGRALSKIALDQLAEITGTTITDDSVDFNLDGSVEITNLRIKPDRESEFDETILQAESVYARFGLGSILMMRPRLEGILVRDFTFNVQQDADSGLWNVSDFELTGPRGRPHRMPRIRLEGGKLQYSKAEDGEVKVIAVMPVEASVGPDPEYEGGKRFEIVTTEVGGFGRNLLEGTWRAGLLTVSGGISSANIPAFGRSWDAELVSGQLKYDPNNDYLLKLAFKDLATRRGILEQEDSGRGYVPKREQGLFGALQWFFNRYRPWGEIDIELECRGNLNELGRKCKLDGTVVCRDSSISDQKFPYLINDLTGRITFTERSAVIENIRGKHNDVELVFSGRIDGFGSDLKSDFRIQSNNMLLDDDLYAALKPEHKRAWDDFSPTPQSVVAIDYRAIRKRSGEVQNVLYVDLMGTDARYTGFPYPLENLTGRLIFNDRDIEVVNIVSQVGERRIHVNGEVRGAEDDKKTYDVVINAENIELDSVLLSALPEAQQKIYNQLGASGHADAEVEIFTTSEGDAGFIADVYFKRARLGGQEFPFQINDVFGQAAFTADSILIKRLEGRYGGGDVRLRGTVWPADEPKDWGYKLELGADEMELSKDFIASFPQWFGMNLAKLQPEGRINFTAELNKEMGTLLDYAIDLECLGNAINLEYFPYPLTDVRGQVELRRGEMRLVNLTGRPRGLQIEEQAGTVGVSGLVLLGQGSWERIGFLVQASDILFDERFGNALPEYVQSSYERFSPTGRFDLSDMKIVLLNGGQNGVEVNFEGDISFEQCSARTFAPISAFNGRLEEIKGSYSTVTGFTSGAAALKVDSFRIKGARLNDFHADILYDEANNKWQTRNISGDFYGGGLIGNFELAKSAGTGWVYTLDTSFDNVELERFLEDSAIYGRQLDAQTYEALHKISNEEPGAERVYTKGKMGGHLSIEEQLGGNRRRLGRIQLSIDDMEVGRLSPISKLLLVLNLTEPTDYAFERMLVDAYLEGERVNFENFDLSGDSVAFTGAGVLNLKNQQVDLKLTARGKRLAGSEPGLFQSLREGISSGVVRLDVSGDIYDPKVKTKTLPVLEATLGILGGSESDLRP